MTSLEQMPMYEHAVPQGLPPLRPCVHRSNLVYPSGLHLQATSFRSKFADLGYVRRSENQSLLKYTSSSQRCCTSQCRVIRGTAIFLPEPTWRSITNLCCSFVLNPEGVFILQLPQVSQHNVMPPASCMISMALLSVSALVR